MKRLWLPAGLALLLAATVHTANAATTWKVTNFHSDIAVETNGVISVSEKISVDFGPNQLHGIYRSIPISYTAPNNTTLYTALTVQRVTQDGQGAEYSETKNKANDTLTIGNPNLTISGAHTYVISYTVNGVLSSYPTYDELYWNVTGNDWGVPIDTASATVTLPSANIQQYSCYQGLPGSTTSCNYSTVSKTAATFSASSVLGAGEGLTVAVGYTKGLVPINVVSAPSSGFSVATFVEQFSVTLVALVILLIGYTALLRRRSNQRINAVKSVDTSNTQTIMAEYEPPFGLRPGQVGGIKDQKVDTIDITATIVDLAVRGYLTITVLPKSWLGGQDYLLTATSQTMDDLQNYEQLLLSKLFKGRSEVKLSQLKNSFYTDLAEIKDELYQNLVTGGYFVVNPAKINVIYYSISILLLVTGGVTLGIGWFGVGAALLVGALINLALKRFVRERSVLGQQALQKILGYKLFVSATEKYRQPYFEKQNLYMEVLPYAIVFGVTQQLAQAFKEMGITPPAPTWYISNQPFVAFAFAGDMAKFSSQLGAVIAAAPHGSGSGGAGAVGGGFGGGGGGAW